MAIKRCRKSRRVAVEALEQRCLYSAISDAAEGTLAVPLTNFTSAGARLDLAFGTNGISSLPESLNGSNAVRIALQGGGKIILVGEADSGLVAARLNADGTADPTFGTGGVFDIPQTASDAVTASAVLPGGKIMIGAWSFFDQSGSVVLRLNSDGSLDTTFGSAGTLSVAPRIDAIMPVADGGVLLAGVRGRTSLQLLQVLDDGSPDRSFGIEGKADIPGQFPNAEVDKLLLAPDGRIVIAGSYQSTQPLEYFGHELLLRCNIDGSIDTTFNHGSPITTALPSYASRVMDALLSDDGGVLVAAMGVSGLPPPNVELLRYNADGSSDGKFGTNGAVLDDGGANFMLGSLHAAIGRDGEISLFGFGSDYSYSAHFAPDGQLLEHQTAPMMLNSSFSTAALEPDGSLVAGGYIPMNVSGSSSANELSAARLLNDGYVWSEAAIIAPAPAAVIAQDRSVVVDARRQRQLKLSRLKALLHFDKLGLRAARRSAHASKISHVPLSDPQALTHLQEMLNQDRRAFNNLRHAGFTGLLAARKGAAF